MASLPSVFPLRLHLTLTGVPTHKLLMHVCFVCFLPLANSVRYAQPRVLLRKFLFTWVNFFGGQLGIKKYVLKDVHRDADLDDTSADSGTPLEGKNDTGQLISTIIMAFGPGVVVLSASNAFLLHVWCYCFFFVFFLKS